MLVSEGVLKWTLRFYPPLFFQRIWIIRFHKGFRGVEVKIGRSILNKNYHKSIFGGTIYAAADPFYPLLFNNIMSLKGYNVRAWTRSSAIRYHKPAHSNLHFKITISDSEIVVCEDELKLNGRFRKSYLTEIFDKNDKLCASVINEIYMRDLHHPANKEVADQR
ncbi:DUF4442 domain-containing protein [Mucilaginibacter sp.]|uniref:DUF4442 domain-containing protein n=1 Tax=Mucilaginibacter sp. TaxID=1882438 RepID=UPI00283C2A07|nr:DUF4442 domain-containing protein [Mucilaginibacter sp.]MDR3694988.1 DUF4442 domain-containing protein [Mucilaginibacter sp.]